jgi:hypothetical protein
MTDPVNSTVETTAETTSTTNNAISERLTSLGVSPEFITKIVTDLGAATVEDLSGLTEEDLVGIGMKKLPTRSLLAKLEPAAKPAEVAPTTKIDPNAELAEDEKPSKAHMSTFAGALGADPMMLMMLMNGQGGDMDLSGMIPIPAMVDGYNPKRRDMYLMVMGQVEQRLGVPIICINADGSINRALTVEYIEGIEEGREPAENNIYFDSEGEPHEVIRVGVDAQSIYDADPLNSEKALQKSGMGFGRVMWNGVSLEVKQVAWFAVTKTKEIDPKNDGHMAWMREKMKPGVNRLVFHGQAPLANSEYNAAARTGSLPTLRVMLAKSTARRPEIMPRRRATTPRDLSGIDVNPHPISGDGPARSRRDYDR